MSDTQAIDQTTDQTTNQTTDQTTPDSDIEAATAQGWNPDYEGSNKKTAQEFLHDGRFFKQIDQLKSENSKLRNSFNELTSHYHKVRESDQRKAEAQYKQTIEDLKQEKVTALDEGDNVRVVEIDEQIRTTEQPEQQPETNPDFKDWLTDNNWYNESVFLQVEADKVGEFYFKQGHRGRALFDQITAHVKELHPDKFTNQKRTQVATVEGGASNNTTAGEKFSEKSLTSDERAVFRNFKAVGVFKDDQAVQDYLKQVQELRE